MRLLLLILLPFAVFAEEAVEVASEPAWLPLVTVAITALVAWVFKLLRSKWKIESQHEALDATKSLWEQRNFLIDNRLIPFALDTAEHWLITMSPSLIAEATKGGQVDWSAHWDGLKDYTKKRILAKFREENIDILQVLGEKELNDLITRVLLRLLGKLPERITSLLPDSISQHLSEALARFLTRKGAELLSAEA